VRRRRVQVEVALLHVLAVIALRAAEPEQALLQDGVAPVPEGQREAEPALAVGDAEQPVLAPAVGTAARVVVGEVRPDLTGSRVVLAHRAPLPLGQIRAPALPVLLAPRVLGETRALGVVDPRRRGI